MNTALQRSIFKSPNTHSVGEGKANATFTLTDVAIVFLGETAAEAGVSRNRWIRDAIAMKAAAQRTAKALALKAAIKAQERGVVCSIIAVLFVGFVEVRAWGSGDPIQFRAACVVRTVKGGKREDIA